eukprot:m.24919 g.24919  ORF g.24919 m.24919 type:complete len:53 (+) comp11565_c0_seq9:1657-1815(+)
MYGGTLLMYINPLNIQLDTSQLSHVTRNTQYKSQVYLMEINPLDTNVNTSQL